MTNNSTSTFCAQKGLAQGKPVPCSQELFEQMLDSKKVAAICKEIAELDPQDEEFGEKKAKLKKRLPIIIPHAKAFVDKNGEPAARKNCYAVASGLVMLDVDHVDNPRELFEQQVKPVVAAQNIYFAAITPSGKGLRLIAALRMGESIVEGQLRLAQACGIKEYDSCTKDLARPSFMMPRGYVLHYDAAGLFGPHNNNLNSEVATAASEVTETAEKARVIKEVVAEAQAIAEEPALQKQGDSGYSKEYNGIPYVEIGKQLMISGGYGYPVAEGNRNNAYYHAALKLRYICDFDADWLYQVLPNVGLSEAECLSTIQSAIKSPRAEKLPMELVSALALLKKDSTKEEMPVEQKELPLPKLPRVLEVICRKLPASYRPAMVISSLPILGALATGVRFRYLDGQEHALNFFVCVSAPAASGKSFIRKPIDLLLTPINEQDKQEFEKDQEYKDQLKSSRNKDNQPSDPKAAPRNNGVNISVTRLLQLLSYNGGKHLIGISEEMDSLIKSEKAGAWSEKSDIYRLAFDNAEYGQAYCSETSFSGRVKIYYNLLLTGTPGAMYRFFSGDALEDGLMTRTAFAQLPDMSFTTMPHFQSYNEKEVQEMVDTARRLMDQGGMKRSAMVEKAIKVWVEEKRQMALKADSKAMDTFRKRSAVIGFRAGMIAYLLEPRGRFVGDFATWVAEYVFQHQMAMFGDKLERILSADYSKSVGGGKTTNLLNRLPMEFGKDDLINLRVQTGQSIKPNAICNVLRRWQDNHYIVETAEGRYKQVG